jgi:hypothetical protein
MHALTNRELVELQMASLLTYKKLNVVHHVIPLKKIKIHVSLTIYSEDISGDRGRGTGREGNLRHLLESTKAQIKDAMEKTLRFSLIRERDSQMRVDLTS